MHFVVKNYSIHLFIRWRRDLKRSSIVDEYLYLFSTQIYIRKEARNRFNHAGSLVDLFNLCQLHISYTIDVKLLRYLIKEKVCHYFPGGMGERGYNEKRD